MSIEAAEVHPSIPESIKDGMYKRYKNAGSHYLSHAEYKVSPKGKILEVHPAWRPKVWDACRIILKEENIKLQSIRLDKTKD